MTKIKNNLTVILSCLLLGSLTLMCVGLYLYSKRSDVQAKSTFLFCVPKYCKNLGLIGSTPHPTKFLLKQKHTINELKNIKLHDFLDVEYVKDSFKQTLNLCKQHDVDHLLVAYLPVYFHKIKARLGKNTPYAAKIFYKSIAPQMKKLIKEVKHEMDSTIPVTLITPAPYMLKKIPSKIDNFNHYARYLIKQFPILDRKKTELETITIINTQTADTKQNNKIIDYLSYEYLYERPVKYQSYNIKKDHFHRYN